MAFTRSPIFRLSVAVAILAIPVARSPPMPSARRPAAARRSTGRSPPAIMTRVELTGRRARRRGDRRGRSRPARPVVPPPRSRRRPRRRRCTPTSSASCRRSRADVQKKLDAARAAGDDAAARKIIGTPASMRPSSRARSRSATASIVSPDLVEARQRIAAGAREITTDAATPKTRLNSAARRPGHPRRPDRPGQRLRRPRLRQQRELRLRHDPAEGEQPPHPLRRHVDVGRLPGQRLAAHRQRLGQRRLQQVLDRGHHRLQDSVHHHRRRGDQLDLRRQHRPHRPPHLDPGPRPPHQHQQHPGDPPRAEQLRRLHRPDLGHRRQRGQLLRPRRDRRLAPVVPHPSGRADQLARHQLRRRRRHRHRQPRSQAPRVQHEYPGCDP